MPSEELTPEERARELVDFYGLDGLLPRSTVVEHIATAFRAAVEAERERAAKVVDDYCSSLKHLAWLIRKGKKEAR